MKKSEIKTILDAMKTIRIGKITDKDVRNALIRNHVSLIREAKKFDEDSEALRKSILGAYDNDLKEASALENELQDECTPSARCQEIRRALREDYKEVYDAITDLNNRVAELAGQEVTIEPMDAQKVYEALLPQDVNTDTLARLNPLFE